MKEKMISSGIRCVCFEEVQCTVLTGVCEILGRIGGS